MKRKIVISTGNQHKVDEIKNILKDLPFEVISKTQLGIENLQVIEDGNTLEENSIKKAKALSEMTDYMVIADDSGLFVDALDGQPGIYSSRYGGEEGNDSKNNERLLKELKNTPLEKRSGRFRTVIALIKEDKEAITIEGQCKGSIAFEKKGQGGFGYDPVFIPEGYNKSFAELGKELKNEISHRAKALEKLKKLLLELMKDEENENINNIWYPWIHRRCN